MTPIHTSIFTSHVEEKIPATLVPVIQGRMARRDAMREEVAKIPQSVLMNLWFARFGSRAVSYDELDEDDFFFIAWTFLSDKEIKFNPGDTLYFDIKVQYD